MNYPDLLSQGYQVLQELGRNREGGRITWLASKLDTSNLVVIKQFCFAQEGASWSAFAAHEREIQVLQELSHPGIPKYLGAFENVDGFCLIQEYINAPTLASQGSFDSEDIKQIAIKALEILVYLQNLHPSVIHRDIKPENILVDERLNVYLIDFGMSRIGSEDVSGSSIFKGTPGFLPPEQIRQPTLATDLYGLGATLICLLTGTPSTQIQRLTDEDDPYLIKFKHLLPQSNRRFLHWLELMVQPKLKDRFANAQEAIDALKPCLSMRLRKPVIQNIQRQKIPYIAIAIAILASATISGVLAWFGLEIISMFGLVVIPVIAYFLADLVDSKIPLINILLALAVLSLIITAAIWIGVACNSRLGILAGVLAGSSIINVIGLVIARIEKLIDMVEKTTTISIMIAAGLGASLGIGCIFGFMNPYILIGMAITGLSLATMLLYPIYKQRQLVAKYRQSEEHLIKP